jgi:hypothetical protein
MKAFKISSLLLSMVFIASISMASINGTEVERLNSDDKIETTKQESLDNSNNFFEEAADIIFLEANNNPIGSIPMDTRKSIIDVLTYPEFAQDDQQNDLVAISFTYTEEGYLKILSINSSDEELNPYITRKLEKIRLKDGTVTIGKAYYARFQFKVL